MLRDEIFGTIRGGGKGLSERLFQGFEIEEEQKEVLLASLASGHHLLILGPPGSGKTVLADRLCSVLSDIEVVEGCPLNCSPEHPSCPWCLEAKAHGKQIKTQVLPAKNRIKRVQGGGELVPEDLTGALDPEAALLYGLRSLSAFSPGKLLRANRGILLVDLIDRVPERALNTLLFGLEGGSVTIGAYEEKIPLDILMLATGSQKVLEILPLAVLENFDIITLGQLADMDAEKRIVTANLAQTYHDGILDSDDISKAVDIVRGTRTHHEVERGVSTRGGLRYTELMASLREVGLSDQEKLIRGGAYGSLPHRLQLAPHCDVPGKRDLIVDDVLDDVLGTKTDRKQVSFSKDDMMSLVEEIVSDDKFRTPLKCGAFDLLLKRVQRFPDSKLAQMVSRMTDEMIELYSEDLMKSDSLTEDLLNDVEAARKRDERLEQLRRDKQADALAETLEFLERERVLERGTTGWEISKRGVSFLLDKLSPNVETSNLYGYGKHSTGKKLSIGEGREVGVRHFRFGDRYKDVSFKDTLREAIRNRRQEVTKDDIMVTTKDIRAKIDFVLVLDLSGTMRQLEKLWHAKESAIVLSLAAAQYGDRVGVVTFSNLADVAVDITSSPQKLTKRVVDLELHKNAFTNIGYGILKGSQLFARHRGGRASQHMILISDGDATAPDPSPKRYALRQATMAAKKGITISCVCINEQSSDVELMKRISRIGKGRIYYVGTEEMSTALLDERITAGIS
ncbi:MAG: VWA domain-containing protein [Chloroflexota bacterium]|nr:VWA domain-containing protein [Chloroflexota bacterium]